MTIAINEAVCSAALRLALKALGEGKDVRRSSWPEGQFLRKSQDGRITVFREGRFSSPSWEGPSSNECDASDWVVF
ncbi:Thoeris anti-defense Tad2 family protein [Ralstonia sp. 121560039-2]|jgi:hypothetical protein|nr:hypothetical protein [Ralstonia insidiosa]MBA9939313.1 hypothetical protein [Ralstonia insidiosa]